MRPPNLALRNLALFVSSGLLLVACEESVRGTPTGSSLRVGPLASASMSAKVLNSSDAPGALVGRYRAAWPRRTDADLEDRLNKIASILRSRSPKLRDTATMRQVRSTPFDDQDLVVSYKPDFDDLSVSDRTRVPETRPADDIGEEAARAVVRNTFDDLVATGLAKKEHYDLNDLGTGHHRRREYAGDGSTPLEYVVEYRFRALRKLNGFDVANNGIVVGVNTIGSVSSIRIGGVQIHSSSSGTDEIPTEGGSIVTRAVSTDSVGQRFEAAKGLRKHIVWTKKMYVMPTDRQESVLEPMIVFRYSEIHTGANGEMTTPAMVIGYSLSDSTADPMIISE